MNLSSGLQDAVNNMYNPLESLSTTLRRALDHYLGDGDVALDNSSDLVENELIIFHLCTNEEVCPSLQLAQPGSWGLD